MSSRLGWIKDIVAVCTAENMPEEARKECFSELERRYNEFSIEEKQDIRNIMNQFENNDAIYVLSCINAYMDVEDFREAVLDCVIKGDFTWMTGSMLELQTIARIKRQYGKKRIFHKQNMDRYEALLMPNYPYVEVKDRNRKRIVIMTEQILSTLHAPTKVVLEFAYALQECMGYEVMIFACPCDAQIPQNLWYKQMQMNSIQIFKDVSLEVKYKGATFKGYQINMTQSSPKEYAMMLSLIYYWNPLFVYEMGAINPIMDLTTRFTTVVAMAMSISCPISEGSILIRLDKDEETLEQMYAKAIREDQKQIFIEEKMPVSVEKSKKNYTRSELGLPEERFLIAIVGNRLDAEIDNECIEAMAGILQRVPNAAFVIIGAVQKAKQYFIDEIFENKIYYLGYCKDLMGVYTVIDLYMNPKRKGGGFSSSMAMQAGVPIVTFPYCDVAYNVGEEFVVGDWEQMIDVVYNYAIDSEFYALKKKMAEINSERNTEERMVEYVENIMTRIIEAVES